MTKQGKGNEGKARQDKARQGKARARKSKARKGNARQGKTRECKERQGTAKQRKAMLSYVAPNQNLAPKRERAAKAKGKFMFFVNARLNLIFQVSSIQKQVCCDIICT